MSRQKDSGKIIARIANPGGDARDGVRQMQQQNGAENTKTVYMPRRRQMLIGPQRLITRFTLKTRIRHLLTGQDDPNDAV